MSMIFILHSLKKYQLATVRDCCGEAQVPETYARLKDLNFLDIEVLSTEVNYDLLWWERRMLLSHRRT